MGVEQLDSARVPVAARSVYPRVQMNSTLFTVSCVCNGCGPQPEATPRQVLEALVDKKSLLSE